MPQALAGLRTDPPVSVPNAPGNSPAHTPAPEPDDDPPGWCSGFHGLRAGGNGRSKLGPPMANSCVDSLPTMMAPAWRSWAITAASCFATLSSRIFEWQVVGRPATSMMSFTPMGTPCSGPRMRPAAISFSAARAASIAASASSRMKACSRGSSCSMRASSAGQQLHRRQHRSANARDACAIPSQCAAVTARSRRASAATVPRPGPPESECPGVVEGLRRGRGDILGQLRQCFLQPGSARQRRDKVLLHPQPPFRNRAIMRRRTLPRKVPGLESTFASSLVLSPHGDGLLRRPPVHC